MNKKFLVITITLFAVFGLLLTGETKAGSEHNVSGWAWSENIGWISFNNTTGGGTTNYGVNINSSTGVFSGYAWSEHIGWISFNESELTGCPTSPCQAKLDFGINQVSGWAKALTDGGGWNGWIKLRGTDYGVWIDTSVSPNEFRDWAWSDMVIGWVSFNCKDTGVCATSNYKVIAMIGGITCSVSVPTTWLVNQWFNINVSGSQGAIAGVRFASDNNLNGVRDGSWDPAPPNYYDWNTSSGNWNASTKTMKWSFANPDNYEVWAEVKDGAGNTRACYDTILILECYPDQEDTCISDPWGCTHTIRCTPQGTWPPCGPGDECYPGYTEICDTTGIQTCTDFCTWGVCIVPDGCPWPPDITCPICQHPECNTETNEWSCQPDPAGTDCGDCRQCDGAGICNYFCTGAESSCECVLDSCIDCSNYYGESCGYRGICHCGPAEKPVWSCSNWQCQCVCQSDPSCEWEPDEYPEVVISPPSGEVEPGEELSYEITIINPTEQQQTYTLIPSVPSGWSYWIETTTVTIPAGQSVTVDFRVTPPEGVPSGEYDISVTAQNEKSGTGYAKAVIPNQPPAKPSPSLEYPGGVDWDYCSYQGTSIPIFYWNYSDPEGDDQAGYEIIIENTPNWTDSGEGNSPSYTIPLNRLSEWRSWMSWNTNYWWLVKVKDNQGNWSGWSDPTQFTTPLHAAPSPDFNLSKERVSQNEVVTAADTSLCYTSPGNAEVNCRDLVGTSYEWDFDYDGSFNPVKTTKGNTTWVYTDLGEHMVVLRITDDLATCYSETKTLRVTLPLPKWKEIAPF